jgi:beta-phosphoglucomutase
MNIDAVIFDFDGVIVNSMPIHYRAYREVFMDLGIDLTEEDYYNNIGGVAGETIPKFLNGKIVNISNKEIHNRKKNVFNKIIDEEGIELLETAKLIQVFHKKYKLGIASAGAYIQIHKMLNKINISHYFDTIITGDDVKEGKPSPEAFLLAAKNMEISPKNCIVFEDSFAGIEAAKSAGMQFFHVKGQL